MAVNPRALGLCGSPAVVGAPQIQISYIQSVCPVLKSFLKLGVALHACNHVWEAIRKDSRPTKETKLIQRQPGLCAAVFKKISRW